MSNPFPLYIHDLGLPKETKIYITILTFIIKRFKYKWSNYFCNYFSIICPQKLLH